METTAEMGGRIRTEQQEALMLDLGGTNVHTNYAGVTYGTFTINGRETTVLESSASPHRPLCDYRTADRVVYGAEPHIPIHESADIAAYRAYDSFHGTGRDSIVSVPIPELEVGDWSEEAMAAWRRSGAWV